MQNQTPLILNKDFRSVHLSKDVDLCICDPPYGRIIKDKYDHMEQDSLFELLIDMLKWMGKYSKVGTSAYVFGATGTYRNRPFFRFAYELEECTNWRIHNVITWAKRRGYGTQKNWIYAREEILFLVYNAKYPKYFIPKHTDKEHTKEWKDRLKNSKYKTKKAYYRRTNVISDINEIFGKRLVMSQKPRELINLLVETSCPSYGFVVDPMSGSGTTGAVIKSYHPDKKCICIEKDKETFNIAKQRIEEISPLFVLRE